MLFGCCANPLVLTVIDPTVSVGGVTSTLARIDLPGRPMDWAATVDDKQVFVSMLERGQWC